MTNRTSTRLPRLHPLTICAMAILIAYVVLSLLRLPLSDEPVFSITPISPAAAEADWVLDPAVQHDDSWMPMRAAYLYLSAGGGEASVYQKVFIEDEIKFQYPLTSLFVTAVVSDTVVLNWISAAMVLLTALLVALLFNQLLARAHAAAPHAVPAMHPALSILLPVVMTLTFVPLLWSFQLGQIQTWLTAAFALAALCWLNDQKRLAGIILGLMILIKPQYGLLIIWGLLRRQWGFCISCLIVVAVGGVASLAWFGWEQNWAYIEILSMLSRYGETFVPNQSVNGLLNRLFETADPREWTTFHGREFNLWVYVGTLVTSLVFLGLALFGPSRQQRGGLLDFFVISLAATMASPVAWTHHYGILLPMYAAAFVWVLAWMGDQSRKGRVVLAILCMTYLMIGTHLGSFWALSSSPLNVVQSYPFFGAFGLLVILLWLRSRRQSADQRMDGHDAEATAQALSLAPES